MKYQKDYTGDRPHQTEAQVRRGARKRILQRRINSFIVLLLIVGALAGAYFGFGKNLIGNYLKKQVAESADEQAGTKTAVGIFQRKQLREAQEEFDESKTK